MFDKEVGQRSFARMLAEQQSIRALWSWVKRRARSIAPMSNEDLAQQSMLRAMSSEGELGQRSKSYLARTARNIAIDQARALRARGGAAVALDDLHSAAVPWVAPDQEASLLLKQVIMGLPPLYRDVFILSRFTGLSYEQIAQRHGITVKAVEYRMSRALALCQEALRD